MRNFRCSCGNTLDFESTQCITCGHAVGYLPERGVLSALEPAAGETWRALAVDGLTFRLCRNYAQAHVCNWLVPAVDPEAFCLSCRLNRDLPDVSVPRNRALWHGVESAKRRLLYTLYALRLPVLSERDDSARDLGFSFHAGGATAAGLCDAANAHDRVLAAYDHGVIVINTADQGCGTREAAGEIVSESCRSMLGHLRHESGHHYWFRLLRDSRWLGEFRGLFGDERRDYAAAMKGYHETGNVRRWRERHVSAYASAHPWEDWAETWAHYLRIVDALETAEDRQMMLGGRAIRSLSSHPDLAFEELRDDWTRLSLALNAVTRSSGAADSYSSVVSEHAAAKLRFVHDLIRAAGVRD